MLMRSQATPSRRSLALAQVTGTAVMAFCLPIQAFASNVAATPGPEVEQAEAVPEQDAGTGDIVVTARKREERLRDVPVAVSEVSGALLERKNITSYVDLTVTVASFQYSTASSKPILFIRGFGSGTNAGFVKPEASFSGGYGAAFHHEGYVGSATSNRGGMRRKGCQLHMKLD